jgi:hypothetical protein
MFFVSVGDLLDMQCGWWIRVEGKNDGDMRTLLVVVVLLLYRYSPVLVFVSTKCFETTWWAWLYRTLRATQEARVLESE